MALSVSDADIDAGEQSDRLALPGYQQTKDRIAAVLFEEEAGENLRVTPQLTFVASNSPLPG